MGWSLGDIIVFCTKLIGIKTLCIDGGSERFIDILNT